MNGSINVRTAFGIVIVSLVLSGLVTSRIVLLLQDKIASSFVVSLTLLLGELLLIAPLLIILWRRTANIRQTLRINSVPSSILAIAALFSLGIAVLADELDRLIAIVLPPPDEALQIIRSIRAENPLSFVVLLLAVVLVSAVVEELLFRGFLQQILENRWQDTTRAVLVTSIFFALVHLHVFPWGTIQIYLLGVLLGFLAWQTNSVFPSMVFHGVNNLLAFTFANWGQYIDVWYSWRGHVSPVVITGGVALTFIGFRQLTSAKAA